MKKRIFWILAALVALVCLLTVSAGAVSGACGDNLTWELDNNGTLTISGTGSMKDFGWDVSAIPWWDYAGSVTALVIEEGVTTVSDYAFQYCSLEEISLPETLTHIGQYAFAYSYLYDVSLPDSLVYLGEGAFSGCNQLQTLDLGKGSIEFGAGAFSMCNSLWSVKIPYGVTELPYGLFESCESLNSIVIPATVTTIGDNALSSCYNLWDVYYGGTADMWYNVYVGGGNECLMPGDPGMEPGPGMGGPANFYYGAPIVVQQTTGGTVSVDKDMAAYSEIVTVTVVADEGYEFSHVLVNGSEIEGLEFEAYDHYGQVSVSAVFTEVVVAPSVDVEVPTENGATPEFTIDTEKLSGTDNYAVITVGGKTERVEQADWADGTVSYSGLAAKDLTQTVTMGVYDAEGTLLAEQSVSVADALKEQLKTETDTKEITKIKAMLHYGAAAQQYFGTNTENLANSGIGAMADVSAHRKDDSLLKGKDFSMICGTSMVHEAVPQMKFYFTTDSKTVLVNGEEVELEASAAGYYTYTVDVAPEAFFETITVTVMDGSTVLATITDSVASYCARLHAQGGTLSKTLADALLNYGLAVKA